MYRNDHTPDAYVRLVSQLCEAISSFANATGECAPAWTGQRAASSNDNGPAAETAPTNSPSNLIGMNDILREFGLKQPQVLKLRQSWGFPSPVTSERKLLFSRSEIQLWAKTQPNRDNLAIVLRSRKRQRSRSPSIGRHEGILALHVK
jgi:predicted DNA-binding transcriptional regulator AlpA